MMGDLPATLGTDAGRLQFVASMPDEARAAFQVYCDLPVPRSMNKLYAALCDVAGDNAPSRSTVEHWSAQFYFRELAKTVAAERMALMLDESRERLAELTDNAIDRLGDLLNAERAMMTPAGDTVLVPDNQTRLAAVREALDRNGLAATARVAVTHSGPTGGAIPVAVVDVSALAPEELLEHLRQQVRSK
jgi:hypothetical protein